jgi:predicted secreted hydrolase
VFSGQEIRADVSGVLGGGDEGFARASAPRPFRFPDDHGPHPAYRSEWWYYTGNLRAGDGRRFGFQLTFFRFALSPEPVERASAWGTNQVYMAHFAVTDVAGRRFHAAERFGRGALDLAGARAAPYRVWLGRWQASAGSTPFPLALQAEDGGYGIDLVLARGKPVVANGEAGLSRKSAEPGNASYYYSIPRMPVSGRVTTPEGAWEVEGAAWFDREWSSSALAPDQVGWDWFALQLSDGRDLMVFRLRTRDGGADPHSAGTPQPLGGGFPAGRARSLGESPGRCPLSVPVAGARPERRHRRGGDARGRRPGAGSRVSLLGRSVPRHGPVRGCRGYRSRTRGAHRLRAPWTSRAERSPLRKKFLGNRAGVDCLTAPNLLAFLPVRRPGPGLVHGAKCLDSSSLRAASCPHWARALPPLL